MEIRVLVAEDVELNQILMQSQLEALGIVAVIVGDGGEALDALEREVFDVVLMDVEMPTMDGLETTRRIRQCTAWAKRQPYIIAVTAHVLADSRQRFLDAGMDDFVSKPVRIEQLRDALLRGQMQLRQSASTPPGPDMPSGF